MFRDHLTLKEVRIPESVTAVGERAFHATPYLARLKEQALLPLINGILTEAAPCGRSVTIPASVRRVCGWAFANQYELEEVRLESHRTFLEDFAFRNCIRLHRFTVEDRTYRLERMGDWNDPALPPFVRRVFQDCMNCFKADPQGVLETCTGNIPRLCLPPGITAIAPSVFANSNLLEHIALTPEVLGIGDCAFSQCRFLAQVTGGVSVKSLGEQAFFRCVSLQRAEFGPALVQIGRRAFEGCSALTEIILPEGLKQIPERAFFRCRSLRRVVLPSTLAQIGREAFAYCESLTQLSLPAGIAIGERAFAECPWATEREEAAALPCPQAEETL